MLVFSRDVIRRQSRDRAAKRWCFHVTYIRRQASDRAAKRQCFHVTYTRGHDSTNSRCSLTRLSAGGATLRFDRLIYRSHLEEIDGSARSKSWRWRSNWPCFWETQTQTAWTLIYFSNFTREPHVMDGNRTFAATSWVGRDPVSHSSSYLAQGVNYLPSQNNESDFCVVFFLKFKILNY